MPISLNIAGPLSPQRHTFSHLPRYNTCETFKAPEEDYPVPMAQETVLESQPDQNTVHKALYLCKACAHVVPRTVVCLYCGDKIPKEEKG